MINNIRKNEFIEVVSKIDETNMVLINKSDDRYEGELFFNRKKRYIMNLCAVCDSNKKYTYFLIDWSNNQHDQRIFSAGDLHKNPINFFCEGQYRDKSGQGQQFFLSRIYDSGRE